MTELHEYANRWAEVALANIEREFPHAELLLLDEPDDLPRRPREIHPSFYGSYDWHSCVEMHWVLVRLLRLAPDAVEGDTVRRALDAHLDAGALSVETENLPRSERPYGYAWTLMLAAELDLLDDDDGRRWRLALGPLLERITGELLAWLPRAAYPVRGGLHGNSAFSLSVALRYARGRSEMLAGAITSTALRWFEDDADYPARYEPSGTDFLSPALTEAELMAAVLEPELVPGWLERFLPGLAAGEPAPLFEPVSVSDPSDGQLAHLHGLNLSRAWCFGRLAGAVPAGDQRAAVMLAAAGRHCDASIAETVGSHYMVEHWLAAYALLATTDAGPALR